MNGILIALAVLLVIGVAEAMFPLVKMAIQRRKLKAALSEIAKAIDLKDAPAETRGSSVDAIAVRIAKAMRLPEPEVKRIRLAAMLHDIGKVGVSTKILKKPGTLDPAEQEAMRRHSVIGAEIMKPVELLSGVAEIVR